MPWQISRNGRVAVTWGSSAAATRRPRCADWRTGPCPRDQRGVELLESRDREEHLATHLDHVGHRELVTGPQPVRDALHRAHVGSDVLPDAPVTTRGPRREPPLLIGEVDRQPVDLELAQVGDVGVLAEAPADPGGPRGHLLHRECVVKAHHPLAVLDRGELGRNRPAHLLRRRVRRAQIGMGLLELLELMQQRVELGVGGGGAVQHVVAPAVVLDQLRDLPVTLARPGRSRRRSSRRRGRLGRRRRSWGFCRHGPHPLAHHRQSARGGPDGAAALPVTSRSVASAGLRLSRSDPGQLWRRVSR
jgi:hypothetical protein